MESALQGGSMITAKLATGYNRDVMAYPGAVDATHSGGCNHLIKSQQAHLIEGIEDLEYIMRWERNETVKSSNQKQLFVELTDKEQVLFDLIKDKAKESLDNISLNGGCEITTWKNVRCRLGFHLCKFLGEICKNYISPSTFYTQ